MCRLMASLKPVYITDFIRIARKDSRGLSHGDGWGYASLIGNRLKVKKSLEPIWEDYVDVPRAPFILHARRARKLPRSLDHLHPHICEGIALAHNGGVEIPSMALKGLKLARRTSSEKLACLLGKMLRLSGNTDEALSKLSKIIKPRPSANFVALVAWKAEMIVFNYHNGDEYYVMWRKGYTFSSEPLGEGWEPLSKNGEPKWVVMKLTSS